MLPLVLALLLAAPSAPRVALPRAPETAPSPRAASATEAPRRAAQSTSESTGQAADTEELPDAADLLDRARARAGDPAKLDALKSLRARATAAWIGVPGKGTVTEVRGGFGEALIRTEFESFGTFELGSDGTVVWERTPLGITIRTGWDACDYLRDFALARHPDWRRMYSSARTTGLLDDGGVRSWRIELVPRPLVPMDPAAAAAPPPPDVWILDAETLLLRRAESRGVALDGTPSTTVTRLSDWRAVDGILHPHHVEMTISGFTLVVDYASFEHDVELPDGFFALDEEVARAVAEERDGTRAARDAAIVVEELEVRHLAAVRTTCKHGDLQKVLTIALPETMRHVTTVGATLAGPPLVRYWTRPDENQELEVEAAMPVTAPIEGKGRVQPATLPAGPAIVAWHLGPYTELGATHERVEAWMSANGWEPTSAPWDEYWTDPGMEPDPSKWRTKVVWPAQRAEDDDE